MAAMNPPTSGGRADRDGTASARSWPRDGAASVIAALVAVGLAVGSVGNQSDAAHDAAVARVLGLRAQAWRALDVVVGNALGLVPVGTRSARAEWAVLLATAAAAAVVARLAARLLASSADAPRVRFAVSAIAASTAAASAPWQLEAASVGGAMTGALLALGPLAFLDRALASPRHPSLDAAVMAGAMGLAFGHEPLLGVFAAIACAVRIASDRTRGRELLRAMGPMTAAAFVVGLTPGLLALARVHAAGEPLGRALATAWAGENGGLATGTLASFCRNEIGWVLGAATVVGIALSCLLPPARSLSLTLTAAVASGLASAWLGVPAGPLRYGGPILAALGCCCALAAVAMQAAVRAIATARLPFAHGSAAMILVLEVVLPVETADGTLARLEPSQERRAAASAWNELALGTLPPRTVILTSDPRLASRVQAAAVVGAVRGDMLPLPIAAGHSLPWARLADDPALLPLSRDLALSGAPGEASLSGLAATRPVAMSFDPKWGGAMARHLVPLVFFERFEREPRGSSDRRKALEIWSPIRERLVQHAAGDPDLPALR
jgi:hypothetical protein